MTIIKIEYVDLPWTVEADITGDEVYIEGMTTGDGPMIPRHMFSASAIDMLTRACQRKFEMEMST